MGRLWASLVHAMLWRLAGYTLSEVLAVGLEPLQRDLSQQLRQPLAITIRDVAFVGSERRTEVPDAPQSLLQLTLRGDFAGQLMLAWPVDKLVPFIMPGRAPSERVSLHDAEVATEIGCRLANGVLVAVRRAWGLRCYSTSPRLCDRAPSWSPEARALLFRLQISRSGNSPYALDTVGLLQVEAAERFEQLLRLSLSEFLDTMATETV